jgi:GrpB-like predicted nucleotidyltransferase (UPF0157 family)
MPDEIERAIREEVELVAYRDSWPREFEQEKARLLALWPGAFVQIEHFGSTAVPGMQAKPIVDILAGVATMFIAQELFEPLLRNGYTTSREFNAMLADRKWFMRVMNGRRTHHLHVVECGGQQWQDRLRFRDILRQQPDIARQYGELKRQLADKHRQDREAYTDAKTEFVAAVLAAAASAG